MQPGGRAAIAETGHVQRWGAAVFRDIISEPIASWHNIELAKYSMQYADLLAETISGRLWHIELQS